MTGQHDTAAVESHARTYWETDAHLLNFVQHLQLFFSPEYGGPPEARPEATLAFKPQTTNSIHISPGVSRLSNSSEKAMSGCGTGDPRRTRNLTFSDEPLVTLIGIHLPRLSSPPIPLGPTTSTSACRR
eukprot:GFKZ01013886.1.p1 GENE.GFKZ01013886.1~~GFKZ01013886.1.p1  ORF type:complete len:129 (+),score=3.54 GFKZ01013886.1:157-543(+)